MTNRRSDPLCRIHHRSPVCIFCVYHSTVGTAIGYGLDGPGIEYPWGRNFPHQSRLALGPTQPPVQWVPGLSQGKERPGLDADPSPPSSAVVMKV
jgi:hypothetical protein